MSGKSETDFGAARSCDFGLSEAALMVNKALLSSQLRSAFVKYGRENHLEFDGAVLEALKAVRLLERRSIDWAVGQGIVPGPAGDAGQSVYLTVIGPELPSRVVVGYFGRFLNRPAVCLGNIGTAFVELEFDPAYCAAELVELLLKNSCAIGEGLAKEAGGRFEYECLKAVSGAGLGAITAYGWLQVAPVINHCLGREVVDWKSELFEIKKIGESEGKEFEGCKEHDAGVDEVFLTEGLEAIAHEALGSLIDHGLVHGNPQWQRELAKILR